MPRSRPSGALATAALLAATLPAATAGAQTAAGDTASRADRTPARDTTPAATIGARPHADASASAATTAGLILLSAVGTQVLQTPTAWPRTAGGFGRRVADQTGFYLLQTGTQRALAAGLGWRNDGRPCPRRAVLPLAGCAVARTFTAVDRGGTRRAHVPFIASVTTATAASAFWRPERRSASETQAFVATRLAVVFAGFAGERLLAEWRHGRDRGREH